MERCSQKEEGSCGTPREGYHRQSRRAHCVYRHREGDVSLIPVSSVGTARAVRWSADADRQKKLARRKRIRFGRRGTYKDYVDLYFIMSEHHASLEEIITLAEQEFRDEFNSRLFAERLLFMDDVRDYQIDFLKAPVTTANMTAFFGHKLRELPLV